MKILNPYIDKSSEVQTYIEDLLKKDTFRKMVHAGAEIPNYILPYPIKMNDCYLRMAENVVKRLGNEGVEVQLINLYEIMLAIIGNDLEDYFAADMSKDDMFQDFSNILDLNNSFLPYIANQMDGSSAEIVIFSGIGEAYPFVRIHSLLEAIPTKVKTKKPIVVFYPGSYDHSTGNSCFRLFGKLDPVNYYRAYNIFSEVM